MRLHSWFIICQSGLRKQSLKTMIKKLYWNKHQLESGIPPGN